MIGIQSAVPTNACVTASLDFTGEDGLILDRLGFDVVDGTCSPSAPYVYVSLAVPVGQPPDVRRFFCPAMTVYDEFTDANGVDWQTRRVELGVAGIDGREVLAIAIVAEGSATDRGPATIDNIAISAATIKFKVPKRRR